MRTIWTDPFLRLPLELSTTIFHLVILNDFWFPKRPFDPPAILALSQACRTWRKLIYSTPIFWNMLRLHDPTPTYPLAPPSGKQDVKPPIVKVDGFANQLSKWMKNSQSAPFYLKFTFPKSLSQGSRLMTALLSPPNHASHFYHLDLTVRPSFQCYESLPLLASELQHRFPRLGYFKLRMPGRAECRLIAGARGFVPYDPDKTWGAAAPYPRGWSGSQPQILTKLHLEVVLTPDQARKILLDASPSLVECTVEVLGVDTHPSGDLVSNEVLGTLPCLRTFSLTAYHTPTGLRFLLEWEMPELETLTVRGRKEDHDDGDPVGQRALNAQALRRRILRKLAGASTKLKSVTFDAIPLLGKDDIFLFIRSSRCLSHLSLINIPGLAQNYQAFFEEVVQREQENGLKALSVSLLMSDYEYYEVPQPFPIESFVRFAMDHGHGMGISLRLVVPQGAPGDLARSIRRKIKEELARCGVDKDIWPKLQVVDEVKKKIRHMLAM